MICMLVSSPILISPMRSNSSCACRQTIQINGCWKLTCSSSKCPPAIGEKNEATQLFSLFDCNAHLMGASIYIQYSLKYICTSAHAWTSVIHTTTVHVFGQGARALAGVRLVHNRPRSKCSYNVHRLKCFLTNV